MKRIVIFICHVVEIMLVVTSALICIGYALSGHDNLTFGMERITDITGYVFDDNFTELILHKTNPSDSIVMVEDFRGIETIVTQMDMLVETDARWSTVHIAESEAYETIRSCFSSSYQTAQHFRPICEISRGYYDYMFYETTDGGIKGCLVDIETGTIALYIFNK